MSTLFQQRFGRPPTVVARAPGRLNLIGEHTDYNGGVVLPMAIERETRISAAPSGSRRVNAYSSATGELVHFDLDPTPQPSPDGRWVNYLLGVVAGFLDAGVAVPGFDVVIESTVPVGGGLSSSAALEVAIATVLEGLSGRVLDPRRKADLCRLAEHTYAGVPCGPMDQTVVALGRRDHLLRFDCGSGAMDWVEFSDPSIAVMVINTRVQHALAAGEYRVRRRQCEAVAAQLGVALLCQATEADLEAAAGRLDPLLLRRGRHVLSEQRRTQAAIAAIQARDWPTLGATLYASHASLRDDFEVSCAELDAVVRAARSVGSAGGVHGCRMTGGGFGGCAVAVVDAARAGAVGAAIAAALRNESAIEPEIFVTRAAQGATLLEARLQ
jgi:galactokinase